MKISFLLLSGLLSLCSVGIAQAVGPGNVPGVKVWMQSSIISDPNSKELYSWRDVGGDSVMLLLRDRRGVAHDDQYKVKQESVRFFNFQPALLLSGEGNLEILLNNTDLSQLTIVSVWAPNAEFDRDHFLYHLKAGADNDIIMTQSAVYQSDKSERTFDYGSVTGKDMLFHKDGIGSADLFKELNLYKEKTLQVQTYYRTLPPANSIWGEASSLITLGESYPVSNSDSIFTNQLRKIHDSNMPFYGFTPEFIVYNRILDPLERMKVETYLAIKYGLTLDASYVSSKGRLLWDVQSDSIYSNRITGYGRDDNSGFYQTQATTSYEEGPYFAYNYGSYLTGPYYKSTPYRLLVVGKQKASPIEDSQFLLMGDNGDSLSVDTINNTVRMKRRWMINTNMTSDAEEKLEWSIQGLMMRTNKLVSTIAKAGSAVTKIPLKEQDGYFSWTTGEHLGPVTVKFGTTNPEPSVGSNDYGYFLDHTGAVYAIEQGARSSDIITSIGAGQKVEIEKEGNFLFLRINGHKIPDHRIVINSQDVGSQLYGAVMINSSSSGEVIMNDFRHGGFVDTGDWIELSYVSQRADNFLNYNNVGKSFLLIDRSGTGNFLEGEVDTIPSTDVDLERSKIIFNNIFWNKNGTGKEIFTFGYKISELSADVAFFQPTCEEGIPMNNGIISVKMDMDKGLQGFSYSLQQPLKWPQTGVFFGDTLTLDSLAAGTYRLTISEIGGVNFTNDTTETVYALSQSYASDTINTWMEWSISQNTNAIIGFMVSNKPGANPYPATPHYGICIEDDLFYSYIHGKKTLLQIDSTACRIRLERAGSLINFILYDKDGKMVVSREIATITPSDYSSYYYGSVELKKGSSVYNVRINGFGDTVDWYTTNRMLKQHSNTDLAKHLIILESPCNGEVKPPEPPSPSANSGSNHIGVYKNQEDRNSVKVAINLDKPSSGKLLVWDVAGNPISVASLAANLKYQELTVTFPGPGLYIIKVKTNDIEDTIKVLN